MCRSLDSVKELTKIEILRKRISERFPASGLAAVCREMLSLNSKVAALFAQNFRDPVAIAAVNDPGSLNTNMSHKIWQKIAQLKQVL